MARLRVAEALRAGIEGIGRRLGYPAGLITVSVGVAEFDSHRARGRSAGGGRPGVVSRQGGGTECGGVSAGSRATDRRLSRHWRLAESSDSRDTAGAGGKCR